DSMEVRIQERQVDRPHPLHQRPTDEHLAAVCRQRVWFLFQRQSQRGPSALEPGQRTAPRRILQTPNSDVQRLRSGGKPVFGHGPEEELLKGIAKVRSKIAEVKSDGRKDFTSAI